MKSRKTSDSDRFQQRINYLLQRKKISNILPGDGFESFDSRKFSPLNSHDELNNDALQHDNLFTPEINSSKEILSSSLTIHDDDPIILRSDADANEFVKDDDNGFEKHQYYPIADCPTIHAALASLQVSKYFSYINTV